MKVNLLLCKDSDEPRLISLPDIPRIGDEVKYFGGQTYVVKRVVFYIDSGYPRIYVTDPSHTGS